MNSSTLFLGLAAIVGCGGSVTTFGDGGGTGGATSGSGGESAVVTVTGTGTGTGTATATSTTSSSVSSSSSSGNMPAPTIKCGQSTCDAASEVCCANRQGTSCIPANDDCPGLTLTCSSAASCSGDQVCCTEGSFQNLTTKCMASCPNMPGPGGSFQLCDSDAECPDNEPCTQAFGGFKVCGGFGPGGPGN